MITCEINVKGGNESEAPDGFIAAVDCLKLMELRFREVQGDSA
jgi:hypothetical protein